MFSAARSPPKSNSARRWLRGPFGELSLICASGKTGVLSAALLLAAGQAEQAEEAVRPLQGHSPQAAAVREVIAAVKHQTLTDTPRPETASQWMARSYYLQSQGKLPEALEAARSATEK